MYASVQLRSNNVPPFSIEEKTVESNLIFVDPPGRCEHIIPVIVQDDQLVVSIPEQMERCMITPFRSNRMILRSSQFAQVALIFEVRM